MEAAVATADAGTNADADAGSGASTSSPDASGAPDAEGRATVAAVAAGWRRQGRPVDLPLDGTPRSLGGTPAPWARSAEPAPVAAPETAAATDEPVTRYPDDSREFVVSAESDAVPFVDLAGDSLEPDDDSIVPRPSLPRRASSFVRRWVVRVVSYLKRLPARFGLGRRQGSDEADSPDR